MRRYGGCARDTFGYAGFLGNRSANLCTAATFHRVAAICGSFTPNPPTTVLFTVINGISTEDLLVNLSETLASANALSCNLAFDLEGSKREQLLGVTQLIELAQLLADRVHAGAAITTAASNG